jgi:hypothetical protein
LVISAVTEQEILLLQEICKADHKVYAPQSSSAANLRGFDELVASLQEMKKAGWIELEAEKSGKLIRGYLRRYKAAAARCTPHGREALRMLEEG